MKNSIPIPCFMILLLPAALLAEPRDQVVKSFCGTQLEHNTTIFVQNFFTNMEDIRARMRTSGFGAGSVGSGPDTDYGLGQCYGDLSLTDCASCHAGARTVVARCYPANGATVFLDGCFMRSENYSFFHEYSGPNDQAVCGNTTAGGSGFRTSAVRALSRAVSAAPNSGGYARARAGTGNESAYVLANCWRTIDAGACRACLQSAYASISGCFPSSEGRALKAGCFLRYSDTDFLNPAAPGNGNTRGTIIAVVTAAISASIVLAIASAIGVHTWRKRVIQKKRKGDSEILMKLLRDKNLNFNYSTLEKGTGSFNEANKIGQGGFGTVYKGILPDGRVVAVKRLFFDNRHRAANFLNEVNIISSIDHKNLVRLLGCSCLGPETLFVYEFLPNTSLDRFIFDPSKGKELNWEKRFEIIIGIAEGLVHLHENTKTRIIHRDIKASNILLDSRLRAKIADFGLARSFQEDQSHISTAIAGTLGYMAPEYIIQGKLTEKTDVYSFGVLLLEIVTGRPNNGSQTSDFTDSLITTAWKHFQERTVEEIFGPDIMQHNHQDINIKIEIFRVVHVALLCTQKIASFRPAMSKALLMLLAKEHLPPPSRPPFMDETNMKLDDMTGDESPIFGHGNAASAATISHSIFLPR